MIRLATPGDAAPIHAIYAPIVRDTFISFELEAPDAAAIERRILATLARFPWLVFEDADGVAGYAYAAEHRERAAYQWSVDVSCYVHPRARRRGIGGRLYRALFAVLARQGFTNAFAGIALPNEASVALHERFGFRRVAVFPAAGFKLGAWHDVGWWWLALVEPPPATPRDVEPRDVEPRDA